MSLNHLLVKLINKILTEVDKNTAKDKYAVILTMLDWSRAFEKQSHIQGVQSFIDNGVRPSLIPVLISFFKDRELIVKWKGIFSDVVKVTAGGPQGGTAGGILEYLSQTSGNLSFLPEDEAYKFVDDGNFIEVINLVTAGLASFNVKASVPSDMAVGEAFLPSSNFKTQAHLNRISKWTEDKEMQLNPLKTKYMIFNFCSSSQFSTRLTLNGNLLEQVSESCLLGVHLNDQLKWHSNTKSIIQRAYQRMAILRNLSSYSIPQRDLVHLYNLYIRSILEQSSVVWGSAITERDSNAIERAQKCALRTIYKSEYISYSSSLERAGIPTLKSRRSLLSRRFSEKCIQNDKTKDMFPENEKVYQSRRTERFKLGHARHDRLARSALYSMKKELNSRYSI